MEEAEEVVEEAEEVVEAEVVSVEVVEVEVVSVVEEEVSAVVVVSVVEAEAAEAVSVEVVEAEVVVEEAEAAEAVALEEDTLAEAIVTLRTSLFPTNTTQLVLCHPHHCALFIEIPNTLIVTYTLSFHLHPNLRMLERALRTDQY